jgi:hypothetical protein
LAIRWDDSTFVTGSLVVTTNHKAVVSLKNNKAEFQQDSINKFRLGVRDQYPPRTFNTNKDGGKVVNWTQLCYIN